MVKRKSMTEVVAALIWQGDKFMICQRPAHKARGLLWEFVGGKVESGETKEQALIRECKEELNIVLNVGGIFMEVVHEYPDITVHLTLFFGLPFFFMWHPLHLSLSVLFLRQISQKCPTQQSLLSCKSRMCSLSLMRYTVSSWLCSSHPLHTIAQSVSLIEKISQSKYYC